MDSDTEIQPSSHRSHHLDRDRDYEINCENNKRNITNGCTSGQKHKRDYSLGNKSNSNDIPPHGSIRKRWKYTDNQSYDKSNAYQGNEKYFNQKSSEKCYGPKHSNERFHNFGDHQSYEKSNAYEVNKFTDQKSSEKGYMPECDDKLPAVHPVNEKSPAHCQVNENSPAVHHDIQSRLTCDDYHSRDQAVYTTSLPKYEAIFPCVFCNEEFNDCADLKKHWNIYTPKYQRYESFN